MRIAQPPLVLLAAALSCASLGGCTETGGIVMLAADAASVMVLGRTMPDLAVSGVPGRDCSAVRLEQGHSYCRPQDPPLAPPPFCTRSLGGVQCWANPDDLTSRSRPLADAELSLTPAQEADRMRRWPQLW
jgi:hypothetical protein